MEPSYLLVIGGGSSDSVAGIGQEQLQQQRRIAHGGQTVQQGAAAADGELPFVETAPRAVQRKTLAALAVNPRGRIGVNPLIAAIRKPIEARENRNQGQERERSPGSSGVALPVASASSQPPLRAAVSISQHYLPPDVSLLRKYASVVASQRQISVAAAELHIPQPPPRSRSCSRHAVAADTDPPATTFVVPVPPPRSRSSSRTRASADTQSSAKADFLSRPKPPQIPSSSAAAVAVTNPVSAALSPLPSAKRLPDASQYAGGGSVGAGPSSKKAGSKQPKKSTTQALFEAQHAEYEESMRRMGRDGVNFFEC